MLRHAAVRAPLGSSTLAVLSILLLCGASTRAGAQLPKPSAELASLVPGDPTPRPEDALWQPMRLTTFTRPPFRMTTHAGKLVLAGTFTSFGRERALGAVLWDGTSIENIGTYRQQLFSGVADWSGGLAATRINGFFLTRVAETVFNWNGSDWDTLATANMDVARLVPYQGGLAAIGSFTVIGGVQANHAAFFDGTHWSPMGTGIASGTTVYGDAEVVGNQIFVVCGTGVQRWNGAAWSEIAVGTLNSQVNTLTTDGVDVYVGGSFTKAGADSCPGLARWDGTAWRRVGIGGPYIVGQLRYWNGTLVAGIADGSSRVSQLVNGRWQGLGDNLSSPPTQLGTWGTRLVVVGISQPNPGFYSDVRIFDGTTWTDLVDGWGPDMTGCNNFIDAGRTVNGKLYAAGANRLHENGTSWFKTSNIAAWDGSAWAPLGAGVVDQPVALGQFGNDVAVGGHITSPFRHIGSWNGFAWTAYGTDSPFYVEAAHDHLGIPCEGTDFGVYQFDGTSWVTAGTLGGIVDEVDALEVWNGMLIAGGPFLTADGQPMDHIAAWDGNGWSPLGVGLSAKCVTLAVLGTDLIAGGPFTEAGGVPVGGVARWDGAEWTAMGTRAVDVVSLTVMDGALYALGTFQHPDGERTLTVGRWNGAEWDLLGSGGPTGSGLFWVAGLNGDLYVGGGFGYAFGKVTANIIRLPSAGVVSVGDAPHPARLSLAASPNPARGPIALTFTLPVAGAARLSVYDVAGREVARPLDGTFAAGERGVRWETERTAPGIYFARLTTSRGARAVRIAVLDR